MRHNKAFTLLTSTCNRCNFNNNNSSKTLLLSLQLLQTLKRKTRHISNKSVPHRPNHRLPNHSSLRLLSNRCSSSNKIKLNKINHSRQQHSLKVLPPLPQHQQPLTPCSSRPCRYSSHRHLRLSRRQSSTRIVKVARRQPPSNSWNHSNS